MDSVAGRTRRRQEAEILRRYREWKAPRNGSSQNTVSSAAGSASSVRHSSPPSSVFLEEEKEEEVVEVVGERRREDLSPPIMVSSSPAESEEDETSSSSAEYASGTDSVCSGSDGSEDPDFAVVEQEEEDGVDGGREVEEGEGRAVSRMEKQRSVSVPSGKRKRQIRAKVNPIKKKKGSFSSTSHPVLAVDLDDCGGGNGYIGDVEDESVAHVNEDKPSGGEKKKRGRRRLTADEIRHVLFNTIMESPAEEEAVNPPATDEQPCPPETSSEDEDEPKKPEPSEYDKEIESLYKMLHFCLACGDDDPQDHNVDEEDESSSDSEKTQQQLCEEGQHYLILNEEIGVICKFCGFVREEIKHVLPPFHENPFGESERTYYRYYRGESGNLPQFGDFISDNVQPEDSGDTSFDPSGTVWEIIPGIRENMFPHQRDAFECIWKNVGGGTKLNELNRHSSGGCIIAHAPGSGKTWVAIAFILTYMKLHKNSRPVIIAPAGILLAWKEEFRRWKVGIPFTNMNEPDLSHEEKLMANSLWGRDWKRVFEKKSNRLIKLLIWKTNETVLVLSYTLFAQLAGLDRPKKRGRPRKHGFPQQWSGENEIMSKALLELPGLLILDEGHLPRNEKSHIFKVLSDVKTKNRVILSGTPFQNNFREFYNIMCVARPELRSMWVKNPFNRAVCEEDEEIIQELEDKMRPFYHSHNGAVLRGRVPGKRKNLVYLQPSELQKRLLHEAEQIENALKRDFTLNMIGVHPSLHESLDFRNEINRREFDLTAGAKARFLIRLIELCSAFKERVLVFSQLLKPLDFIKALLESSAFFGWKEGDEILYMKGSQDLETRKRMMNMLNNPEGKAKVLLASTKACSEGISLVGASRVVLLDITWNPAVEEQAISRAYRIGQRKLVHVYRLIVLGTDNDSNKHFSQTRKTKYSKCVFSSSKERNVDAGSSSSFAYEDYVLERLKEEKVIEKAETTTDV